MRFLWPGSLKARITLITLSIFLISVWSLAYYASRLLRDDLRQLISNQQYSTVNIIVEQLEAEFALRFEALSILGAQIGPEILADPEPLRHRLTQNPLVEGLFNQGLIVAGADGKLLATAPRQDGGLDIDLSDRDYVKAALREGRPSLGRPVLSKLTGQPVIVMATPLRDEEGQPIGVLAGVIALGERSFLDKITANHYGKTGHYFLASPRDRMIVTSSKKDRIMAVIPPGTSSGIDQIAAGHEGPSIYLNTFGVEVLASSKRLPIVDWVVHTSITTAEAFAPIRDMQQRVLLATLLITLLAGLGTWWLLHRQLQPMQQAVTKLAALTDLSQPLAPLTISRRDEIGELIASFNQLLAALVTAKQQTDLANQALHSLNEELNLLATTDSLTGAWNRRHFETYMEMEISRGKRYDTTLAMLLFDIDHFKAINDRFGHQTGDRVLIELTSRVRSHLRKADVLARWGGEEFVVLMPQCDAIAAAQAAEKLRLLIVREPFTAVGQITASFGVAEFNPLDNLDAWVKRVDDALYEAKAAGRNCVRSAT